LQSLVSYASCNLTGKQSVNKKKESKLKLFVLASATFSVCSTYKITKFRSIEIEIQSDDGKQRTYECDGLKNIVIY